MEYPHRSCFTLSLTAVRGVANRAWRILAGQDRSEQGRASQVNAGHGKSVNGVYNGCPHLCKIHYIVQPTHLDAYMKQSACRRQVNEGMPGSSSGGANLEGPGEDAVDQAATGDADAAADGVPHNGPNGVQPCCCHLNGGNDCRCAQTDYLNTVRQSVSYIKP